MSWNLEWVRNTRAGLGAKAEGLGRWLRRYSTVLQAVALGVQAVVLFLTWYFAVKQFYYTEYVKPSTLPAHVNAEVALSIQGVRGKHMMGNVEVALTNSSERTVELADCVFRVYGQRLNKTERENDAFESAVREKLAAGGDWMVLRYFNVGQALVIAAGSLFPGRHLDPDETVRENVVFPVPSDHFDYLELEAFFPIRNENEPLVVEWSGLESSYSQLSYIPKRCPEKPQKGPACTAVKDDEALKRAGYRMVVSRAMLSLWPEGRERD